MLLVFYIVLAIILMYFQPEICNFLGIDTENRMHWTHKIKPDAEIVDYKIHKERGYKNANFAIKVKFSDGSYYYDKIGMSKRINRRKREISYSQSDVEVALRTAVYQHQKIASKKGKNDAH